MKKEELRTKILEILVEYDKYVEDRHKLLIEEARKFSSIIPGEFLTKPSDTTSEEWMYNTCPFMRKTADILVKFIMEQRHDF